MTHKYVILDKNSMSRISTNNGWVSTDNKIENLITPLYIGEEIRTFYTRKDCDNFIAKNKFINCCSYGIHIKSNIFN